MGLLFFSFLFNAALAYQIFSNGGAAQGPYLMYSHRSQIDLGKNWPIWNQNFTQTTIGGATTVCPPTANAAAQGGAGTIFFINYASSLGSCDVQEITNFYNQFNPAAYFFYNSQPSIRAWSSSNPNYPPSNQVPVFHVGGDTEVPLGQFFDNFPFALFGVNNTILLTLPDQNPVMNGLGTAGSWYQLPYFSIAYCLVAMLVIVFKLGIFVQTQGIQLSIPQAVLGCVFCSSFFHFLVYGLFGSTTVNNFGIVSVDTLEALNYMSYGFTFTALTILGFYFGEIASLTSAQSVPGLDKMKIPAAVFLVILWAVVWSAQIVEAVDPPFNGAPGAIPQELFNFFFAWLGVIVPAMVFGVMIWGSISLISAIGGSSNTGAIVRIVLVTISTFLLYWSFGIVTFLMFYLPNLDIFSSFGVSTTLGQFYNMATMFLTLSIITINIILALNFSIAVQKEIEVSKSGTSSTSGSSGSSSGSTSSSSSDPVIEL